MAKLTITTPPTGTTPSPGYSDNTWLKYIWAALTNAGASPSGLGGGGIQYAQGATTSPATGNVVLFRYNAVAPTLTEAQLQPGQLDVNGNQKQTLATLLAGEDLVNNLQRVEQRNSYSLVAADTAVKSGAGFLHTLTFSCNDAAPTAGSIIVYDNTAESGTQIFNHTFTTTPFAPFSVILDVSVANGIYVGFTTTNDVNVTVSYR